MDIRTVMLILAVGSLIFGLLLIILKFNKGNPQKVSFWIRAKILQAAGSLMLYFRTTDFDGLTVLANIALLLGCAYEAWAVRILSGRAVGRRLHFSTSLGIIFICSIAIFIASPFRGGLIFLLQSVFYFLPGLFLFKESESKISLHIVLAICYWVTGFAFLICSIICFAFPGYALSKESRVIFGIIPIVSFCIFLVSGFVLLMLAKERSDMLALKAQESLKKSEIRFQQIVETANEGILIFDENYKIIFANKNIALALGYTVDEMMGKSYDLFFSECHLELARQQERLRKQGKDSVYECCLLTKDKQAYWFLVSAKAIIDANGVFQGSFAMLTDINKRKEMELLLEESNQRLTELSLKDSLTGIANRRSFDAAMEHEYSRLQRSNSKLSLILLDVDYFKEYNDYYGHVAGDSCLRQIGKVLEQSINKSVDLAARYGGEEFACILPDTDIHSAVKTAENIRQRIQDLKIEHKKSSVSEYVTASFGVTTIQHSKDSCLQEIIKIADKLLYKAKISGRNTIEYGE